MSLVTEFVPLELENLRREAAILKADGWRFIQTHAVYTEDGIDLYYSFMKNGRAVNYWIKGVQKGTPVPSITDLFLAAFVFENEARELFGVDMRGIALDFSGAMYAPAVNEPMTIISPEQKAARAKAREAALKKASGNEAGAEPPDEKPSRVEGSTGGRRVFVMTPELQARLDAKMPTLSDEKKAKVEAALKARAAEAETAKSALQDEAQVVPEPTKDSETTAVSKEMGEKAISPQLSDKKTDEVLESKIAAMDPAKAAKVRAALSGSSGSNAPIESNYTDKASVSDEQLESLISLMDDAKAATIRAALAAKGGE